MKKLTGIKAIAFDVFGTLVEISDKRRPYKKLLDLITDSGARISSNFQTTVMSNNVGLLGAANMFGVIPAATDLSALELDLYGELASVRLFEETLSTLVR